MAAQGAIVILLGRTIEKIEGVRQEIESSGATAIAISLDVSDHAGVQRMAKTVIDRFGRIDVLVNNAGINSQQRRLLSITPEDMRKVIDTNLLGTIYLCASSCSSHVKSPIWHNY